MLRLLLLPRLGSGLHERGRQEDRESHDEQHDDAGEEPIGKAELNSEDVGELERHKRPAQVGTHHGNETAPADRGPHGSGAQADHSLPSEGSGD